MAKSARASSRKNNNQKLKKNVFGPVEAARAERLSAKLMELVAQPAPKPEENKEDEEAMEQDPTPSDQLKEEASAMDVDAVAKKVSGKKRIEKRRSVKKSSIVFPRYKDRNNSKKRK